MSIELTILMPCLNEERTIAACIGEAKQYIEESGINAEILIADNGSTDNSVDIAIANGARVVNIKEKGYGNALIGGIKAAKGKYVIMGDCDMSYDFYNIDGFITNLRKGYKLVMGNRFKGGIEKGAMPFSHKYIGNPVLSCIGRVCFKTKVGDFHCGIRGFDRKTALSLGINCGGMEFATELVAKFATQGYKIAEIPVKLRKDGRDRKPHLRTIRDGLRHLLFMLTFHKKKAVTEDLIQRKAANNTNTKVLVSK